MTSADAHCTRKVHSATKFSDVEEILSSYDYKPNSRGQCASASCYSNREKLKRQKCESEINNDILQYLKSKTDNNRKMFLNASQILAKLKMVGENYDFNKLSPKDIAARRLSDVHSCNLKLSMRKINFYYDLLKRLLEERCILLLQEEIHTCFKKVFNLVTDLKRMYSCEMIKLATMPTNAYNRFIDSSDLSISVLEHLFKKVNFICDLHSSLKNNYQSIINFFHVGFDMELNQMLLKIYKLENKLYSKMIYWTHKILKIFILKLCLADPESVSPEFLHNVFKTCETFSLLHLNKKQIKYVDLTNSRHGLFNCFLKLDYDILLDFILQYLSHFEAKVAAEKIIHLLIYECKNHGQAMVREKYIEKEKKGIQAINSITSDYYSESPTIIDTENSHFMSTYLNSTFENVFISIIQRNQSLILKYLYSLMSSDVVSTKGMRRISIESDYSTGGKVWNFPQSGSKRRNFHSFEERYWIGFWDKILTFSLKLILEVSGHQYGNASVGVFLFWPHSYYPIIFNFLKSCTDVRDIPPDGLDMMKKMYHILYIRSVHDAWDKDMSSALSIIHGHYCMPIPTMVDPVRTRIGNTLCSCVETLRNSFFKDSKNLEYLYLKMVYPLQMTLDCFIFLTNIKARASVSSGDISTYLLISRSDCLYICNLLKGITPVLFSQSETLKFASSAYKNSTSDQIEILTGNVSEAPNLIYKIIYDITRETVVYKLHRRYKLWPSFNNSSSSRDDSISLNDALSSLTGFIRHVYDGTLLFSVTSAVVNGLLSILYIMQKKISSRKIQVIKDALDHFLDWLEQLNIEDSEIDKMKDMNCFKKLLDIMHILQSTSVKKINGERRTNRIAPVTTDVSAHIYENLTEEEKNEWFMSKNSRNYFCF